MQVQKKRHIGNDIVVIIFQVIIIIHLQCVHSISIKEYYLICLYSHDLAEHAQYSLYSVLWEPLRNSYVYYYSVW